MRNKLVVLASNFSNKPLSNTIDKIIISSTFPSDSKVVLVVAIKKKPR